MKSILILLALFFTMSARAAPDQKIVDQWIGLALKTESRMLPVSGLTVCRYEFPQAVDENANLIAANDDAKVATSLLHLYCIQSRCRDFGSWVVDSLEEFFQASNTDLDTLLQAQGYEEQERKAAIAKRRFLTPEVFRAMTCETAPPLGRLLVFDSCFSQPVVCSSR